MKWDMTDDPDFCEVTPIEYEENEYSLGYSLAKQFSHSFFSRKIRGPAWFYMFLIGGAMLFCGRGWAWRVAAFLFLLGGVFPMVQNTRQIQKGQQLSIGWWTLAEQACLFTAGVILTIGGWQSGIRNVSFALGLVIAVICPWIFAFTAVLLQEQKKNQHKTRK